MLPNAPKHFEMHHNMSLGSDGMDWTDLLQRILLQLCGLNFCFNCNSLAWFEPSIVKQRNGPKGTQTLRNKTKHEFRFQWGWVSCIRCKKFGHDFVAWTFALIAPVQPILHRVHAVSKWSQMHPNTMKRNKRWVWVQWGWLGAFAVKTSDATLWHELLH